MDRPSLLERLARTRSRGQIKALGAAVDRDADLRGSLLDLARERGLQGAEDLNGKLLVRRLLAREEDARVRRNPIHRDEAFTCAWCGAAVPRGGAMVRDHCPRCLRSLHVDVVPGDRAADCDGVLAPVGLVLEHGGVVIQHRCGRCGHEHRVRAHPDDQIPASMSVAELPGRGALQADGRSRTLPRRVLEHIRSAPLWAPGQTVLVAVSGGLDSTVLLELLWRTADAHGARLSVMSLDHGLRPDAAQEVAQVAAQAQRLGLPFHTATLSLTPGPELQQRARTARRHALTALGTDRIATAHHLDDQAETVLQRLVSGSGACGLAGMQAVDAPWCRPLLREPRQVLEQWARAEGLAWVEDPSNPASQRGRVRSLLQGLGELRAGVVHGLARSAGLLAREDALLEALVDDVWSGLHDSSGLDLTGLAALHPALAARAVRRLCAAQGVVPRADVVERVLGGDGREGWQADLGNGRRLVVQAGRLSLA